MRSFASALGIFLLFVTPQSLAQEMSDVRIVKIEPYETVVPGQLFELRVTGFADQPVFLSPDDFRIQITQDSVPHRAKIWAILPIIELTPPADGKGGKKIVEAFQSFQFTIPKGLREGEAEVLLSRGGRKSNSLKIQIVGRPLAPIIGMTAIAMSNPSAPGSELPPGNLPDTLGLKFEKGQKAELHLSPLTDPNDRDAGVRVRFKQGDSYHDATSSVIRKEVKDNAWGPPRYTLQISVPTDLPAGDAEMELTLRANGQLGDPVRMKVQIVDSSLGEASPKTVAPRLLRLSKQRVGVGQSIQLAVDHRRTLEPDPSRTMIVIEQNGRRELIKPEINTALLGGDDSPDAPVVLVGRVGKEMFGAVQVRVLNLSRGEREGGLSEPLPLEIANELIAPEIMTVAESTEAELTPLRQLRERFVAMGQEFRDYDPKSRYVTIRATGLDDNPGFVRVVFEQEGRTFALALDDFSLNNGDVLIVRLPQSIKPGTVQLTIENRSGNGNYSQRAVKTFEVTRGAGR